MIETIVENSADDLMRQAIKKLLQRGEEISPSRGSALELTPVALELTDPVARLSRSEARGKIFSALGELLWYLSGSNETNHIAYYIPAYLKEDEHGHVYGGYGPRLLGWDGSNQLQNIVALLKAKPSSRRAVIQLFDHEDLSAAHIDVPCTCSLQFLVRNDALNLVTYMRSNDAYLGLPHDVFAFTMLQEIVAVSLQLPIGRYFHFVGSLHLYDDHRENAKAFIGEGWQSNTPMPVMPEQDPWSDISELLDLEAAIRLGSDPLDVVYSPIPYWADLGRLLGIHALARAKRDEDLEHLRSMMTSSAYDLYVDARTRA